MNETSFSRLDIGARFRQKNELTAAGRLVEWVKVDDQTAESDGQSLSIRWSVKCILPPYGEDPARERAKKSQASYRDRLSQAAKISGYATPSAWANAVIAGSES